MRKKLLTTTARLADNHSLDKFYLDFENKFRGTEDDIEERVVFYAEMFKRANLDYTKKPIIDIGCGRGELLKVLKRYSLQAKGIDLNHSMVKRARTQGLDAIEADAVSFFKGAVKKSLSAVIGIHIIEHLPFAELFAMSQAIYNSLTENGFVVFETPNPENISVATYSFYMDPSHLHPVPAELMKFMLETIGFKDIEILYLHEVDKNRKRYDEPMLDELCNRMYGPRDYAIVAYRR